MIYIIIKSYVDLVLCDNSKNKLLNNIIRAKMNRELSKIELINFEMGNAVLNKTISVKTNDIINSIILKLKNELTAKCFLIIKYK